MALQKNAISPIFEELTRVNQIKSEKQIALFRILLFLANAVLVFLAVIRNNYLFTASDILNISVLSVSLVYTVIILILLSRNYYRRLIGFLSSTIDILFITMALYFAQFSVFSSIASIPSSAPLVLYFVIILFTVRRHDALNSLYTGILAGIMYLLLIILQSMTGTFGAVMGTENGMLVRNDLINELTKDLLLFLSGFIGYLIADNFDNLFFQAITREKEAQDVKNTFGRYVSEELVEQILANKIPVGGEKRDISVMFMDIKNFTTLSERLEPKALIRVLNEYFRFAIPIIHAHDGFIDKFIGDAIMVVFGAPEPRRDHREAAVACALELQDRSGELKARVKERIPFEWDFGFGVGINSGMAVVGNVGTSERMEYTSLGDTVNVAARLEALTRELGVDIVAGESTVTEKNLYCAGEPKLVRLKGKTVDTRVFPLKANSNNG